jgi:hypothetical protein
MARPLAAPALAVFVVLLAACGSGGGSGGGRAPVPPAPRPSPTFRLPTAAPTVDALAALRNRATYLIDGGVAPQPFVLDWAAIEGDAVLSKPQADAFCDALNVPKADDALASLAALALNALSEKIRHKPLLNDEAETFLGIAATFATKTCQTWKPQLVSFVGGATPKPAPTLAPTTYRSLLGDPAVSWAWDPVNTIPCTHRACWQIEVRSRLGCGSIHAVLAIIGGDGSVARSIRFESRTPYGVLTPAPIQFWSDLDSPDSQVRVSSISCSYGGG